jgi:5'-deoxynucleotidase YfbR-like HD superfamily hydrolase
MKKVVPIITLATDFAAIFRVLRYREGHTENDAEHSYQLALTAWSANHQYSLGLDDERILKYALVHDLVEIYAGDIDAFGNKTELSLKDEKETQALKKLKQQYADFPEIVIVIEDYKEKKEPEAQLVNIMDKLVADANIRKSGHDYYKPRKVTFTDWKNRLLMKTKYETLPEKLKEIIDEVIDEMHSEYRDIFYQEERHE